MKETDIQRACLDWLHARGIFCWRSNQIPVPLKGGGFRRFTGLKGVSDILGIVPQEVGAGLKCMPVVFGNLLAVEVKMPRESPRNLRSLVEVGPNATSQSLQTPPAHYGHDEG